jgi:transposase
MQDQTNGAQALKTRQGRRADRAAARVRAGAETVSEAARREGVSYSAVYRRLHPDKLVLWRHRGNADSARKRRWETEHRGRCRKCDGLLGSGSVGADGLPTRAAPRTGTCATCISLAAHAVEVEMIRLREIEGLSNRQIAHQLSVPVSTVQGRLSEWRCAGVPVARDPYMTERSR